MFSKSPLFSDSSWLCMNQHKMSYKVHVTICYFLLHRQLEKLVKKKVCFETLRARIMIIYLYSRWFFDTSIHLISLKRDFPYVNIVCAEKVWNFPQGHSKSRTARITISYLRIFMQLLQQLLYKHFQWIMR